MLFLGKKSWSKKVCIGELAEHYFSEPGLVIKTILV